MDCVREYGEWSKAIELNELSEVFFSWTTVVI
jgi:hypothetical protein